MNLNIFLALVKAALLTGYMTALVDILEVNSEMLPYLYCRGASLSGILVSLHD